MKRRLIIFACLVSVFPAYAASFDCAKATTKVEKLICDNPTISELDDDLGKAYQEAINKANEKQKQRLVTEQKYWLKHTRNICTDEPCFRQAYSSRLATLAIFFAPKQPAQGGDWIYRDGGGKSELLCQDLLKRLNYYYHQNELLDEQCSWDVVVSYPKFTEPPWTVLDPLKHEELIVNLMKYDQEGGEAYFHLRPGLKEQNPDSVYRNRAVDFIDQGGRLLMWRTRLIQHDGTEQTIVQRWIPWIDRIRVLNRNQGKPCIDKQKISWTGGGDAVTADLSGPDPNVDPATHEVVRRHQLVIYEGKPLLVNGKDVWRGGKLKLDRLCDFEFVKGEK